MTPTKLSHNTNIIWEEKKHWVEETQQNHKQKDTYDWTLLSIINKKNKVIDIQNHEQKVENNKPN